MTWQPESERRPFGEPATAVGIPDDDSYEMIIYGTSYLQVKLRIRTIERIRYRLEQEMARELAELDFDILDSVEDAPWFRDIVYSDAPVPPDMPVEVLRVMAGMRAIAHHARAIALLKDREDRIIEVGRTIGAAEHSARIDARGATQSEWQMSAMRANARHPVASNPIDTYQRGES